MEERRQEVYQRADISEEKQAELNEDTPNIAKRCMHCTKSIMSGLLRSSLTKSKKHYVTPCKKPMKSIVVSTVNAATMMIKKKAPIVNKR